jgi:hypothetical protein
LVSDAVTSTERYRALVGPDAVGLEHGVARIDLKGTVFELVGPDNDRARGHLNSRGEGVLSLELHGLAVKALDRKLPHGADLAIVG